MGKHLVLAGGGHAHLTTLANIDRFVERGHRVTVISPSPWLYYSGMGAGGLSGIYAPSQIRINIKKITETKGGEFVTGKVTGIDAENRRVCRDETVYHPYDAVSFSTGSYVQPLKVRGREDIVCYVKPVENLIRAKEALTSLFKTGRVEIAIVGGGPSSVEIAGNVWRLAETCGGHAPTITIFAGSRFMGAFDARVRSKVIKSLKNRRIEILENSPVREIRHGKLILESGSAYAADYIFVATGVKPSPLFRDSRLPVGIDGGLPVNGCLQMDEFPEIFGGGDCICFKSKPLSKVGVYAVRQGGVLCHNLLAFLEERELKVFDPGGSYMLIFNMGDGTGVLWKNRVVYHGQLAFMLKDYIDQKFIKKFQASEQ